MSPCGFLTVYIRWVSQSIFKYYFPVKFVIVREMNEGGNDENYTYKFTNMYFNLFENMYNYIIWLRKQPIIGSLNKGKGNPS